LYGFSWQGSLALVRIDRQTLRPRSGPRVSLDLDGEPLGWSFAAHRSPLAMGSTEPGAKLRLIDLVRMRTLGEVRIARRGSLVATAWPDARRVLAVVVTPGCCGAGDTVVAGVAVGSRRVLWKRRLGGSLQAGERVGRRLLLVLGPRGRSVGASRLVELGASVHTRSVALPEIQSGIEPAATARASDPLTRNWNPGLAVDRTGARAFVVSRRIEIDAGNDPADR
jgi:hypothetical protein